MTEERREKTPWYVKALQSSIIPLIVAGLTVWITLDRVEARLGNHINSKDVHMSFERKIEKFVDRPTYNLHSIQINKRLDKIDAMQIKIYEKLTERKINNGRSR